MVFGKTRNFYREITENNCPKKKKLNALKNEVFEKLRIKKKWKVYRKYCLLNQSWLILIYNNNEYFTSIDIA